MSKIKTLIFFIVLLPSLIAAQSSDIYEIEAETIASNSNKELKLFYQKFNNWADNLGNDTIQLSNDESLMVNNFIMFSENGLLMKDLIFHSVEYCQKKILEDLPNNIDTENNSFWMFICLESHVNSKELTKILEFLRTHKIGYVFGTDDEIVSKFHKN
jgi:hypothetical protein